MYPVKVSIDIGKVTISCTNQTGDAKEEMYLETEGKELEIGFNPRFFLDALKVIDDEEIFIDFGTSVSPSVIRPIENEDYTYSVEFNTDLDTVEEITFNQNDSQQAKKTLNSHPDFE